MKELISLLPRTFIRNNDHLNVLVFRELLQIHLALMGVGRAQLITGKEP